MATPLRFRRSDEYWDLDRVRSTLYKPLESALGACIRRSWFVPPSGYDARRFEMDNGDIALFLWSEDGGTGAHWIGNTETPSVLWQTDKYTFDETPAPIAEWAQRELLAQLHMESPWLGSYPTLAWFFLPVFLSKDGRETTRAFFADHAAGFPDADVEQTLGFYEGLLDSGILDDHRYLMASKLGTSESLDLTRMRATMGEFNVAHLLAEAGYTVEPEAAVSTGHSIDFRVEGTEQAILVEVTRPQPTTERAAQGPIDAVRETAATKVDGQLSEHGGGVVLFVDCSSFPDDEWQAILAEQPAVRHRPAVVFRLRPDGRLTGYTKGSVPLALDLPADPSVFA
ncbi:MAG: DUF5784 family protein [Halobacteriales archaeon]